MSRSWIVVTGVVVMAATLVACGGVADGADPEQPPLEAQPEDVMDDDYDRDASRARAESLLGLHEDEFEESRALRIVRRGDEHFVVTMDLRPGRLNAELDDDGDGYRVTRVTVETPDDEDPLIVE